MCALETHKVIGLEYGTLVSHNLPSLHFVDINFITCTGRVIEMPL